MFFDAARRVIYYGCQDECEIDPESLPNFNKQFYYSRVKDQQCLELCFNTRMVLHLGEGVAMKNGLFMDFKMMKKEY